MCLGVPVRIKKIMGEKALAESDGIQKEINLAFVPKAREGDYVLLHAGFAIQVINENEAMETLKILREIAEAQR